MGWLGAGVLNDWFGEVTIVRCRITGNTALGGGAVYCERDTTIMDSVIADNTAARGGAIYVYSAWLHVRGCTLANNHSDEGGAITVSYSGVAIDNSILWNGGDELTIDENSTIATRYSDVQGGWPGAGNFDADPLFIDPAAGDYHLGLISPCLNAGDPAHEPAEGETDIDGESRSYYGRVDIGADEVHLGGMPGDVDRNGTVDVIDVMLVVGSLGLSQGEQGYNILILADLNGNGVVDVSDVIEVIDGFGEQY